MANAKFLWTPEGETEQSYTLAVNFNYQSKPHIQDFSDRSRAIDGTLRTYETSLKNSWVIAFKNITLTQKDQLKTIKEAQVDIIFYKDSDGSPTFTGRWISPFNFIETAPGLWAGTIQLEEI